MQGTDRRRWLMPAATAAVVALLIGGAAIAQHGGGSHAARPGASPTDSGGPGIVPWADLPPTHPKIPSHVVGRVTSAQVRAAPACGAGDLRPGRVEGDGAMGTAYLEVTVALKGRAPCRIGARHPHVVLRNADGTSIPSQTSPTDLGGRPARAVLVSHAHPATLAIGWAVSHDCRNLDNVGIRWALGGLRFHTSGFGRTVCSDGEGTQEPFVLPVTPGYHVRRVSPYDGVRVSGNLHLTAKPGARIYFTVTLTSRHDLTLDPCPDFRVGDFARAKSSDHLREHALNCAGVPYRTSAGKPYLPAGVPVRFAMETTAPLAGPVKLIWILNSPSRSPVIGGLLTVSGHRS